MEKISVHDPCAVLLCSAMPVMAVESELGTQENPVADFADLKTLLANAAGSKEDPAEIYVSGMLESTESLKINDGQHIKLIGVGAGEDGLKRTSAFTTEGNGGSKPGDMIDVGNNNGDNVASLVLENIVLDGGAVWSNGENTGLAPGDSGLMSVRKSASAVLGESTILRNNEKGGGGAAIWLQGI